MFRRQGRESCRALDLFRCLFINFGKYSSPVRIFSFLAVVLSMQFGASRSIMTNDSERIKRGGFGPGDFIRRLKNKYYFPVCLFLLLLFGCWYFV